MTDIAVTELEAAINYWRSRSPASGDELRLCEEAGALSKPYALMIVQRQDRLAAETLEPAALAAWLEYQRIAQPR
jgi:hypothetical protein